MVWSIVDRVRRGVEGLVTEEEEEGDDDEDDDDDDDEVRPPSFAAALEEKQRLLIRLLGNFDGGQWQPPEYLFFRLRCAVLDINRGLSMLGLRYRFFQQQKQTILLFTPRVSV